MVQMGDKVQENLGFKQQHFLNILFVDAVPDLSKSFNKLSQYCDPFSRYQQVIVAVNNRICKCVGQG